MHVGATAFLGVSVGPNDTRGAGALIADVVPGGAAAAGGLTAGDLITSIDGHAVTSSTTLRSALLLEKPGARVSVTYVDPTGASRTTTVTLAERTASVGPHRSTRGHVLRTGVRALAPTLGH